MEMLKTRKYKKSKPRNLAFKSWFSTPMVRNRIIKILKNCFFLPSKKSLCLAGHCNIFVSLKLCFYYLVDIGSLKDLLYNLKIHKGKKIVGEEK